ncbi:MAG: primosomal protein N' [Candidatus Magasanikbacteria bacterium]|nr:primosomal protein N' [Candidatus Magasanikbacteria bacterium]
MIVRVILAKRMPLSLPFLDYSVPEKIQHTVKIGQLVTIPFRRKEEFGVIFDIQPTTEQTEAKLKPITKIIFEKSIISKEQLAFIKDISEFYHTPLGFLLKTNLIPLQKRKLQKLAESNSSLETSSVTKKETAPSKPTLLLYKTVEEKKEILTKHIQKTSGQTLILVPEINSIEKIKKLLPNAIVDKTITITGTLNDKELFSKWLQIWSGEKNIVIGTRSALFLPWFNLQHIILDDEGNPNYKSWDMAPRLHTRDAALFLSKSHNAELIFTAHTPSVETLFFAQKKVYTSPSAEITAIQKPIEIIDMRTQRRLKNFSLLSHDLLEAYKKIKTGDIFFFINRRGTVSYVGCRDCGTVLKCPSCNLSLTYHQSTNQLSCHYCHYTTTMPLRCATCQGTNVNMYGAGTQLAEDLIKKITAHSDTRAIIRIDSDENDLEKLKKPGDKIIIGTQMAWAHIDWSNIKLMAFLDADSSLFIPEYKIVENLWQQIRDAQFNLSPNSDFVIQTSHPEHLVFASLFDPASFYKEQLEERRALGYPPFKFLVKFATGTTTAQTAAEETEKLATKLTQLTKNTSDITILGPWETSPHHYNGQYWYVILAKIGYENYKKNTKLLLSETPDSWKIDPNPNSILSFS